MSRPRLLPLILFSLFVTPLWAADVKLAPEQQQAADKLRAKGASVLQIAADSDALAVNLSLAAKNATDEDLASVKVLPKVQQLNLGGTAITDAGLANLAGMSSLTHLHLDRTQVTDAGLAPLKGLNELIYLNLYATKVTDRGLDNLKGLKNLKRLYVWQTEVTEAGAKTLKAALPDVYVNRGIEQAVVVKVEEKPAEKPAEKKEEKPDAAAVAASLEVKEAPAGAKAVNTKCPVTDDAVDPKNILLFQGKVVGFCCENCPVAFKKEPAKYAAKIKADVKPAVIAAATPAAKPEEKKPEPVKVEEKKPEPAKPEEKKPEAPKPVQVAAAVPAPKVAEANAPRPAADGNLIKPIERKASWRFEQHGQAKGTFSTTPDSVVFDVLSADGESWHIQAFQTGLDLQAGKTYVVAFQAKSDENRSIGLQAGQDEDPWATIGLDEQPELTKEWQSFRYTFTVSDPKPNNKNRVGFVVGNRGGKVYVKNMSLALLPATPSN